MKAIIDIRKLIIATLVATDKKELAVQELSPLESSLLRPETFPPADTRGIEVRLLAQAYRPVALPLAEPLLKDIIRCRGMIHAPVVPDCQVIEVVPLVPDLQIVVLHNQRHKPVEEVLALLLGQAIDALHVAADAKHRLPSRHGVGPDERVGCFKHLAHVLGSATRGRVNVEAVALGRLGESGLGVMSRQRVEEGADGGRNAVVDLVA